MIPPDSRFESDPGELVELPPELPDGWQVATPDPSDRFQVARLTQLLRGDQRAGRGWADARVDDVLVEVSERGLRTRENVIVQDDGGEIRAWGSVHDRAGGRMLFMHIVERDLPDHVARACSAVLVDWAVGQAREVGAARALDVQQIDTGAFADDTRQHEMLEAGGFTHVRNWWQMERPVSPDERELVPAPTSWEKNGVTFRLVRRASDGMPEETDLREVHDVLESAFADHFNSHPESFEEFERRLREDPGHRWDHWWLAELEEDGATVPVGALIGTEQVDPNGPNSSYVEYLGVLSTARGRGVAKGLLTSIVADAALRERKSIGIEVDADSPTGANELYTAMGWETKYVTQSWHRDVPVVDSP